MGLWFLPQCAPIMLTQWQALVLVIADLILIEEPKLSLHTEPIHVHEIGWQAVCHEIRSAPID
jgi:hypothetical protein